MEVTEENVPVLQFLDCLKDIDKCAEEDLEVCGKVLTAYAEEHAITKEKIDRLIEYYPMKIYKAIYGTGSSMYLHEDREAFKSTIEQVAELLVPSPLLLEKSYSDDSFSSIYSAMSSNVQLSILQS